VGAGSPEEAAGSALRRPCRTVRNSGRLQARHGFILCADIFQVKDFIFLGK
jgi:hypothetical protein